MSRPEFALHISTEAFLRHAWPDDLPYSHFPAGEVRDKRAGAKLKAMGLKPGWPDFLFVLPDGRLAALELKAAHGSLSPAQKDVRDRLVALGCAYGVAKSLEDVELLLRGWLALFGRRLTASIALSSLETAA